MNETVGKKLLPRHNSASARLPRPPALTELLAIATCDLSVRRENAKLLDLEIRVFATQKNISRPCTRHGSTGKSHEGIHHEPFRNGARG